MLISNETHLNNTNGDDLVRQMFKSNFLFLCQYTYLLYCLIILSFIHFNINRIQWCDLNIKLSIQRTASYDF